MGTGRDGDLRRVDGPYRVRHTEVHHHHGDQASRLRLQPAGVYTRLKDQRGCRRERLHQEPAGVFAQLLCPGLATKAISSFVVFYVMFL